LGAAAGSSLNSQKECGYGGYRLLLEMQEESGHQEPTANNHEERQAGDYRRMPYLRHEDLQDRQSLIPNGIGQPVALATGFFT
jgi:hypothetical protein